jgi:hypothetical protein
MPAPSIKVQPRLRSNRIVLPANRLNEIRRQTKLISHIPQHYQVRRRDDEVVIFGIDPALDDFKINLPRLGKQMEQPRVAEDGAFALGRVE